MFIKKDLRKIATILEEAVDCETYEHEHDVDKHESNDTEPTSKKRAKREEPIRILKLGRRKQEFNGCVRVLCQPMYAPKLKYLSVLNLYECDIHDLSGFGPMFGEAAPNLETMNLGRNPLSKGIPDEFCKVRSLKHLWLDDCKLSGALPRAFLNLPNLESLRLPNNNITHLDIGGIDTNTNDIDNDNDNDRNTGKKRDDGEEHEFDDSVMNDATVTKVIPMTNLKILCLDRNLLGTRGIGTKSGSHDTTPNNDGEDNGGDDHHETDIDSDATAVLPSNLTEWAPNLEELLLRHNRFRKLGVRDWPPTLKILHVSSNRLENLDEVVAGPGSSLPALTHLYANGNRLARLPVGILERHPSLQRLVVSHNPPLRDLPEEVWKTLGLLPSSQVSPRTDDDGAGGDDSSCEILWQPNPNLSAPGSSGGGGDVDVDGSAEDVAMPEPS